MIPKIETLMSKEICAIDAAKSVQDAAFEMAQNRIGSLLVVEDGDFVGIITEVDVIRKVVAKRRVPESTTIKAVMTSPLITIKAEQSILEANALMEARGLRHLPVTKFDRIVGVVSIRDFLHPIDIEETEERRLEHAVAF